MHSIALSLRTPPFQIVKAESVRVELPTLPARFYRHGWQSWSLASWVGTSDRLPIQRPLRLHPMQLDPQYSSRAGYHGSWLGAVELEPGKVVLLGALGLDARVSLEDNVLLGACESGSIDWLAAIGDETTVFRRYAEELGRRLGTAPGKPTPRVWCSWYSLYDSISERSLRAVFSQLRGFPFDVVQVDDGWPISIGDWDANDKFPSGMQTLREQITATGRQAGLWLAPLIACQSSRLFREHRDWFLRDDRGRLVSAGFNWGEQLHALDTTHPLVTKWLKALMQKVRAWGYTYVKLDFLYAGALPGSRQSGASREAAYRDAMLLMREAMGQDAYFVACGAPMVPSLGTCDALRIGPDVAADWESPFPISLLHNPSIPGTRNAIRTTMHRLWLRPLVQLDPDVVYFRSQQCNLTQEQKSLLRELALICGFRSTSDIPQWLSSSERDALMEFLTASSHIKQSGPRDFTVDGRRLDYSSALALAGPLSAPTALASAIAGWLADQRWVLHLKDRLDRSRVKSIRVE